MTNFDYHYPSPTSPKSSRRAKPEKVVLNAPPPPAPVPAQPKSSEHRVNTNGQQISQIYSETKPKHSGIVVQVPPPPPEYKKDDYVVVSGSPKRRKTSHDQEELLQARSQKQLSDNALQDFQDMLGDIFEGQDLIDSSGGVILNPKSLEFFEAFENEADGGLSLNLRTLERLRTSMKKLLHLQRLRDVSVEHLRRLKDICELSIETGKTIDVRISCDPSNEEQGQWAARLSRANNSICCAIVFAYIVIGNPQKEELLSNEMLSYTSHMLENVLDNCVTPVVEARPDTQDNSAFHQASTSRESLKQLLESCRKLLDLMATVCIDVKGGDTCVNTIEFLAARLIFVQNGSSEKNSVLGLQVYEKFRKSAMATLSRIYARFPNERRVILDEILSSLDKLPSNSRSARQFRLGDGKSIQLISALFMQLVQTTAMHSPALASRKRRPTTRRKTTRDSDDEEMADGDDAAVDEDEEDAPNNHDSLSKLDSKVDELYNAAARSAQDIIAFLVAKASGTTKTGDSPYRGILDLLVEDLITVLPSYDWPSAEMLLRYLAARFLDLAKNEKAASVKNMALESLGVMGSAISNLRASLPHAVSSIKKNGQAVTSETTLELIRLGDMYMQHATIAGQDLVASRGPFALVASYLNSSTNFTTLQQQSARSYFVAHFGKLISFTLNSPSGEQFRGQLEEVTQLVLQLMIATDSDVKTVGERPSEEESRMAYLLCILNLAFCRRLEDIVKTLSSSFSSDQAQVRSRSLKSVAGILETDSSLLDRDASIADDIFRCASDDSAMVRDSALSLIARFIVPRKALESKAIKRLLECAADEKVGVSKRAIGHLKEIHLQERRDNVKEAIARKILERLNDHEESIATLAEQTLEDVWIKPVVALVQGDENGAATNVAVQDLASHLMACVAPAPETYLPVLKKFFASLLHSERKSSSSSQRLCSKLVQALFDQIISSEKTQAPLLVLTALAEANPKLMPPSQLAKLKNYLSDFKTDLDLFMFRSAVGIFYHVLPDLSDSHKTLLKAIQDDLILSLTKLGRRPELDAVTKCLSIIDGILQNTERLIKFTKSIFRQISAGLQAHQLVRILRIAGALAKHIDLDKRAADFAKDEPVLKISSISAHFVKTILPHVSSAQPEVRQIALESLGSVCQASPAQFNNAQVRKKFFEMMELDCRSSDAATNSTNFQLKSTVLKVFEELYATRSASKEKSDKSEEGKVQGLKQMGGDAKLRDQDSAISAITMDIVERTTNIVMSETTDVALSAAKTLASISHQGLIHPKQCLGSFVAIGTNRDLQLATVGHRAQQLLHEQHESHCEREYMSAIQQAFTYQRSIGESTCGAVQPGHRAKLFQCFNIITVSNTKSVKRFLSGLVSRTIFDTGNSETPNVSLDHVHFTKFIMQNLAFFEYKKLDELLHLMLQLEMTYPTSGAELAQAIESAQQQYPDLVARQEAAEFGQIGDATNIIEMKTTDPALILALKRLAPAAACLLLLIETKSYLRRQYGVLDVRQAIANSKQAKDTTKAPTKVHGITGEKFWNKSNEIVAALEDDIAAMGVCKDFVVAMNEEERLETLDEQPLTTEPIEMNGSGSVHLKVATPGGRKRKLSASVATTPTKKSKGRPKKVQRRSSSVSSRDDPEADY